jgi:hypothetical protein
MPRISADFDESTYRSLRRIAEANRTRGRASISAVILRFIREALKLAPNN